MHYPFWYVPGLTAPMLIAAVAVLHIYVALYAVGGGLFLAVETRHAYRTGNAAYLAYLRRHAWFFILLTVVYGAITGVGIWWTIGLASPLPTQMLIHLFVFGWAMEYVFFLIEIVSAFIFYYAWDRLTPRAHQAMAWIYAGSAWMSLVIITGITAFMLNPGDWQGDFWRGWANPQTLPQIVARTGASLLLATLYVYVHSSFWNGPAGLRAMIARRSARPAMAGAVLITLGGLWWHAALPASAKATLIGAAAMNLMIALIFALSVVVFFMFYFGPYRHPEWVSPGFAVLLLLIGYIVTGQAEFVREAARKPFVIYGEVYSHNIYVSEVPRLKRDGFLDGGVWTRRYVAGRLPQLVSGGGLDESRIPSLTEADQRLIGRTVFMHHCGSCHAASGYSGMREMLPGWTPGMLDHLIVNLDRYHFFMPPWSGRPEEALALRRYLETLASPHPVLPGAESRGGGA
ncbi:MAG TPA: cytochrome ubiquinol oxidase subunit I [bacterium]